MSSVQREPLVLPTPPTPMTATLLMAYLQDFADHTPIECEPVMINGEPIVQASVVDGRVVLRTWLGELNANPPCPSHIPAQHRDGKPPWCPVCRLTANWSNPHTDDS